MDYLGDWLDVQNRQFDRVSPFKKAWICFKGRYMGGLSHDRKNKLNRMNVYFDRLVTGDEKWILDNNVQRQRTWKKAAEGAKAVLHPMKVLLCVWWGFRRIIHFEHRTIVPCIELLRRGDTMTVEKYSEHLTRLIKNVQIFLLQ